MNGISLTDESSLLDARAVKAGGYAFAYVRGYKTANGAVAGGRDDQRISQHRAALIDAGVKMGVFGDFDHRAGLDEYQQALEIAGHSNVNDALPPAIRLWEVKDANGKVIAVTDWYSFANRLSGVAYHVWIKTHRWPVILANRNQVVNITAQMGKLSLDALDALQKCWWGVIAAPGNAPTLPAPWTRYPFFVEFVAGGQTVSGAGTVAIAHWPGSEAQLMAWLVNSTIGNIPVWGEVDPGLPPVVDPTIKQLQEQIDAIKLWIVAAENQIADLQDGQAVQDERIVALEARPTGDHIHPLQSHTHDVTIGPAK